MTTYADIINRIAENYTELGNLERTREQLRVELDALTDEEWESQANPETGDHPLADRVAELSSRVRSTQHQINCDVREAGTMIRDADATCPHRTRFQEANRNRAFPITFAEFVWRDVTEAESARRSNIASSDMLHVGYTSSII